MDNRRIQQRHFHASLLQLFMKHRPYIRDLLIFEGMADEDKVVTPNMVESLGLVRNFSIITNIRLGLKRSNCGLETMSIETLSKIYLQKMKKRLRYSRHGETIYCTIESIQGDFEWKVTLIASRILTQQGSNSFFFIPA